MESIRHTGHGSGSNEGGALGRLRVGAAKLAAVGIVVAGGGAATMVTAFANTGHVVASESCTSWSVSVVLDKNVAPDRFVDVLSTIPGTTGFTNHHYDTSFGPIWSANGTAPAAGTVTLNIYHSVNDAGLVKGPLDSTAHGSIAPATGCQVQPLIKTNPGAGGPVGTVLHDTATLTGGKNLTGSVSFKLFAPLDTLCSGTPLSTTTGLISSTGNASSGNFTSTQAGTYRWVASYPGDANNKAVASGCTEEAVVITRSGPAITTNPSAGGVVGTVISDSATVTGRVNPGAGDTVTFNLYGAGDTSCAAAPIATSVVALPAATDTVGSSSFTTAVAGTYSWTATYSGDANNAGATSACGVETAVIAPGGGIPNTNGPPPSPPATPGIPATGTSSAATAVTVGGFLLLGGLGVALLGAMPKRRDRI